MSTAVVTRNGQTDGNVLHTGRVTVSCRMDNGTLVTLTLPDDWQTILDRIAALEATSSPVNSLEDLTYGG
jgi:hypothetical protein